MLRSRLPHLRVVPTTPDGGFRWTRDTDVLRRLTALGYLIGASTAFLSIVTPDPDPSDHRALLILAVLEVAIAGVLVFGGGLPDAVIRAICLPGAVVFTSVAVAVAKPAEVVLLFYLWPALQVGYFGSRREARVCLGVFAISLAVALHLGDWQVPLITYVVTMDVMLLATVVLYILTRRTERLMEELESAATHDDLTGLLNRRALTAALDRELRRAQETGTPVSLVLFDLDHFKQINDQHGHAGGDDALRLVAEVLRGTAGELDAVGRHGGEEFVLVLPGRGLRDASAIAQRVASTIEERSSETPIAMSTSAGVATCGPGRRDADALMAAADHALYAAKAAGRRRVYVAPDIVPAQAAA